MDHYPFPHIHHINQVLEAIKGRDEFIVADRGDYQVVNYMVNSTGTFPRVLEYWEDGAGPGSEDYAYDMDHAILRECRGLVFGPTGSVIARRFHKFFNIGEREEVFIEDVDFSKPHVIMEKLDGSMITPIPIYNNEEDLGDYYIRWGTKMGLTEVAGPVEAYVATHHEYSALAKDIIDMGETPIFEWCTRKQRIVLDYPRDTLKLVAIRNNITGKYWSYEDLWNLASAFGIDLANILPDESVKNPQEFIDWVKAQEGIEGFVIRFDDGHLLKVKSDWYCRIHRAKDSITQEKRIIEMLVNEKVDDVKPFLLRDDLKRLEEFERRFFKGLIEQAHHTAELYNVVYSTCEGDRKKFAIEYAPQYTQETRSTIFSLWGKEAIDYEDTLELAKARIRKHLGSQTKVDSVRGLWGDVYWSDYITQQDE